MTRTEIADVIKSFLDGSCGKWNWDDFLHTKLNDSELEKIQTRCANLPEEFPPTKHGHYCNAKGFLVLQDLENDLRQR